MMRSIAGAVLLPGILCLTFNEGRAQKKLINDTSYKEWSWLHHEYHLSNDGRYVSYDVHTYEGRRNYGVLVTTKGEQLTITSNRHQCRFTEDSRYLVSGLKSDSILVYDLIKKRTGLAIRGGGFQLLRAGKHNWLAYQSDDTVIVRNLETGYTAVHPGVKEYLPADGNAALVLRKQEELIWLDLRKNTTRLIFRGSTRFLTVSRDGNRIAFLHQEKDNAAVYHFIPSMAEAAIAAFNNMDGLDTRYHIAEEGPRFSDDGRQLYFALDRKNPPQSKDADLLTNEVEVWHYGQPNLYASRRWYNPDIKRYKAVIGLATPGSRPVQLEDDSLVMMGRPGNNYVLVKTDGRQEEEYFNEKQAPLYLLISLKDGSRKTFRERSSRLWSPLLSDSEKFITWCNKDDQDLYAYEIATGITRNVSAGIDIKPDITLNNYGSPSIKINFFPDAWYGQDDRLLIHDRYDCWLIDPLDVKPPVNITNGYGRKHRIVFQPALGEPIEKLPGGTLILRARDERTGDNGFWQTVVDWSNPSQRIMDPCLYSWNKMHEPPRLCKAKQAAVYLATRQTAAQSINLFVSTDLSHFRQLSFIQPEKEYNWMRSELLLYKKNDGDTGQAILYKPDNFDPSKKYPVIFHFYQERNSELHDYRKPGIEPNQVDIPWYVSNGYLVCIPDINHLKPGRIAETVVNSVEGAARFLISLPWVDSTRLGAQGHSFGGYETLLLIAHSRLFAAAQASAAVSDLVSAIGGMAFGDHELYTWHETGQANMGIGNLPWSNPKSYIDNSPIFHADKINTPLLLMHGYEDENVKFGQDIEMFTALRRLQKPVWILGYKDGHILSDHNEIGKDAALRQRQFFEHYLKGKPAPVWMTKGVNPEDRNYKSGLQLDTSGATP